MNHFLASQHSDVTDALGLYSDQISHETNSSETKVLMRPAFY